MENASLGAFFLVASLKLAMTRRGVCNDRQERLQWRSFNSLIAERAVKLSVLFLGAGLAARGAEGFFVEVVAIGVEFCL